MYGRHKLFVVAFLGNVDCNTPGKTECEKSKITEKTVNVLNYRELAFIP